MDDNSLTMVSVPPPPSFVQYDEDPEFRTLERLLETQNISHGVLATAIENHGIQGWDRYGRFKTFDAKSPEAIKALDLLAHHLDSAEERSERRHRDDPEDCWEEFNESPWEQFGWKKGPLPDFDAIKASEAGEPSMPRLQSVAKHENSNLTIIAHLLAFIRGDLRNRKHPDHKDDLELRKLLQVYQTADVKGLSETNLKKQFERAREEIKIG